MFLHFVFITDCIKHFSPNETELRKSTEIGKMLYDSTFPIQITMIREHQLQYYLWLDGFTSASTPLIFHRWDNETKVHVLPLQPIIFLQSAKSQHFLKKYLKNLKTNFKFSSDCIRGAGGDWNASLESQKNLLEVFQFNAGFSIWIWCTSSFRKGREESFPFPFSEG